MDVFRSVLSQHNVSQPSDLCARRFLEYCEEDGLRAANQYISAQRFKADMNASAVRINDVEHLFREKAVLMLANTGHPSCPPARDREGRLVHMYVGRNIHPNRLAPVDILKWLAYQYEIIESSHFEGKMDEILFLADMKHWTLSNFSPQLEKLAMDTMNEKYPGHTSISVVLNPPWYFRIAWNMCKPFIPKKFQERVAVCTSFEALQKFVDPTNLPVEYGGVMEYDMEKWIEHRHRVEGIPQGTPSTHTMSPNIINELEALGFAAKDIVSTALKSGYLEKRGSGGMFGTTSWKKRFFVISEHNMLYFDSENGKAAHRSWDIRGAQLEEHIHDRENGFGISFVTGRRLLLAAADDADRVAWIELLQAISTGHPPQ